MSKHDISLATFSDLSCFPAGRLRVRVAAAAAEHSVPAPGPAATGTDPARLPAGQEMNPTPC